MANWRNDDNLLVKFGTAKATSSWGGEYMTMNGGKHVIEFDVDLLDTGLSATDAIVPNTDTLWIPKGAFIEEVQAVVTETITGSTPNLDLGLIYYTAAGVLTELDYDGLIIAGDFSDPGTIGEVHTYRSAGSVPTAQADVGALVGTTLATTAAKYYFSWSEETNSYTAGALKIRVVYYVPTTIGL